MQLQLVISHRCKAKVLKLVKYSENTPASKPSKDPIKKLTTWHEKENDAAFELAPSDQNILLLSNRT